MQALEKVRAAVLTVSDRASAGTAEDKSGPKLKEILEASGAIVVELKVVPDSMEEIQREVLRFIREQKAELVVTTGGTGIGPRDVTPEALMGLSQKKIDGIGELLRSSGLQFTKTTWLSRSLGCVIEGSLAIALPGSRNAVKEGMDALMPILPHALHTLRGGNHG